MQNNVYECINISNVANKLKLKRTKQIGNNIYVICPFCQNELAKNGYMKLDRLSNLYICNHCEAKGTSIELYAKIKYLSNKEAFKELLRETPVLDNIPYIYNNPIKDENYRNLVYTNLLKMLSLSKRHERKLQEMGFSNKYIEENHFKSIETNTKRKKQICKLLQEQGFKLDGLPGFYQDEDFNWNYKSHNGIFIPTILNNKIQGLRIFLDKKYSQDTENIWFSSSNEYCGTKANNWPTILKADNVNWINMYNSSQKDSIIIATEIILAHKLFNSSNKTVIGIPNNIDKDILLNIVERMNVSEVFLYVDSYSILHTSSLIYKNVIETLEKLNIKVNFRVASLHTEENKITNETKNLNIKIA